MLLIHHQPRFSSFAINENFFSGNELPLMMTSTKFMNEKLGYAHMTCNKINQLVEGNSFIAFAEELRHLRAVIFAPDMQHEDGSNKQKRHYQNRNRATAEE